MKLLYSSLFVFIAATATDAMQLSNDPVSYFGGTDHQAYLDWVDTIASDYDASVYLPSIDPTQGAAIHWRIVDDEWLYIAVAARCSGWIGFGLSEAGGMLGSDMALFQANRPTEIIDAHVIESFQPQSDDCQQDWILVDDPSGGATTKQATLEEEGEIFLMFQARRKLDTGDHQDKRVVNDIDPAIPAHRVIAAWGDSNQVSYHGTNVARGAIRFYDPQDPTDSFTEIMKQNAEGTFIVRAKNYTIPAVDTEYTDFCVSRSDLLNQGVPNTTESLNIIGFRPIISHESAPYVHHFLVFGYNGPDSACGEDDASDNLVYVWAPGDGPFALPDFLGAPMFGPDGYQSFSMEVHYDNPRLQSGIVDSSGIEFYYTSQPRDMELGVLELGDPFVELFGSSIGNGLTSHSFECPGECSSLFLQQADDNNSNNNDNTEPDHTMNSVTVIREYLHMHQVGTRIMNEQIRNGQVIRQASVEVWDFDQNGNAAVQQDPYEIMPGDSFRVSCYYRGGTDKTTFGLSSRDEMCIAFLYYYPRKSLEVASDGNSENAFKLPWMCAYGLDDFLPQCSTSYKMAPLQDTSWLNREFGEPQCKKPTTDLETGTDESDMETTETAANETPTSGASLLRVGGLFYLLYAAVAGILFLACTS